MKPRRPLKPPPGAGLLGRGRPGTVPLVRALSKLGVCSRTEAARWVAAGRVAIAGVVCRDPERAVVPERDAFSVDGKAVAGGPPRLIVLHKPRGVLTTRDDPKGRPTVYGLLGDVGAWVVPVGRLDYATSGLLLLTNDTRLADALCDPARGVERVYVATVRGAVDDATSDRMVLGVDDGGECLAASAAVVEKRSARESRLRLTLRTGKNREVRRLCAALGHPIVRLLRVRFAGFTLDGLEPGAWREATVAEAWAMVAGRER